MDSNDGDPGKKNKPPKKHSLGSYMAMTQFAYTLVIVTCSFGYAGHWIGKTLLGGSPWDFLLMLLLGGLGMTLDMWRMIRTANSMMKDNQDDEKTDDKSENN